MKNKKYMFVYCTVNLINGKKYIGQHQTNNLEDGYIGSGKIMRQAIKLYGKENFTRSILEFANTLDELNALEIKYINLHDAVNDPNYYNITTGGWGHPGTPMSEDTKNKIRESHIGKAITEETRIKLRESHLGHGIGRRLSDEQKKKISESEKGKIVSDESRRKMSEKRKGIFRDDLGRAVKCIETGEVFTSCANAARHFGVSNNIPRACMFNKTCAGYHWEYC